MMKVRLKRFEKYISVLSQRLALRLNWQRALRSSRSAMGYLNLIPIVLLGRSGRTWVLGALAFYKFVQRTKRYQGWRGVAVVMKVSHTCLMKACAGARLVSTMKPLGHRVALTRSGYPRWIPSAHRVGIQKGDLRIVQFWLTLTSLYRVVEYLGKPKLSTITRAGRKFSIGEYQDFVPVFFSMLEGRGWWQPSPLSPWRPRLITKSGPGAVGSKVKKQPPIRLGNTTSAMVVQAVALFRPEFKVLNRTFKLLAERMKQSSLYEQAKLVADSAGPIVRLAPWIPSYLGKLGVKEEPGKVRVFAMVDWWTQTLLRPLHEAIFGILEKIPSDSTFDQDRGVAVGMQMLQKSSFAASYDLSAATDRLPVVIQELLVDHLYPGCGQLWSELLIGRAYRVPVSLRRLGMKIPEALHYSVGQPMGALSSWGMLALTHHFIVQMAARRAGWVMWFPLYQVLGDDIVIFNSKVARQYLCIMEDLGVEINLVKSVVSKDSFEFAKRFISRGVNLSPVSFRELDVASSSLEAMIMLLSKFQGEQVRIASFARFRGYGYRTLSALSKPLAIMPRHLKLLIVFLSMPGISSVSFTSWVDWFSMTSLNRGVLVNLQSLRDIMVRWWEAALPWKHGSVDTLTPRGIWDRVGLEKLKDWRVEMLESSLQSIMWPQQLEYMEAHKLSDSIARRIDACRPGVEREELEKFFNAFMDWDAENSLTPIHVEVFEHKDPNTIRKRVGRWLSWWLAVPHA